MIAVLSDGERITLTQRSESPIVYFDHWALMDISSDAGVAGRFAAALKARRGTLAISWLHREEFLGVADIAQARAAEHLLDQLYPNLFFIDSNPYSVIRKEDAILQRAQRVAPHADSDTLRAFFGNDGTSINPLSFRDFLTVDPDGPEERVGGCRMRAALIDQVQQMRSEYLGDPKYRADVLRMAPAVEIERGTRLILREVMSLIVRDAASPFLENDALDLLHTSVPVAYCDHVLLDSRWATIARQASARLRKAGMPFPFAQVHSGRRGGLASFLAGLENGI